MLAMAADGYRYTADTHDLNSNVNATGRYVTSLPNPYYDRDDDNSDSRWDEAEIAAESATFPSSATIRYYAFLEYSPWYQAAPFGAWTWDSGSGCIEHNAQLALPGCPGVCDKWDAAPLTPRRFGDHSCPSLAKPAISISRPAEPVVDLATADIGAADRSAKLHYRVGIAGEDDVRILPDLSQGLGRYAERAAAASSRLAAGGPIRAVMTFERPVGDAELAAIRELGVGIEAVEGIALDGDRTVTVGTSSSADVVDELRVIAASVGATFDGVVSVEVSIRDRATYDRATDLEYVYLVDASAEHFRRLGWTDREPHLNDVYWTLVDLD